MHGPSITVLACPTTRCRAGVGRVDVTPPVGIYHRLRGAARADRAAGVHRPLTATTLLIGPDGGADFDVDLFIALDHCLLRPPEMDELLSSLANETGVARERIVVAFSHSHAAGHLARARADLP